ncbi:MAG TPA: hypothetical protein VK558_08180 [Patescibacteria group bacterium]|nr:hypothetical protein [Patescibacteria group bacterium]
MAGKARADIISDITQHIAKNGGGWGDWYVGVTDSPKQALFTAHRLRSTGDAWISRKAKDDLQAVEVEEYFRTVCKTVGNPGRTTLDHVFVYAYRRKPHTKP